MSTEEKYVVPATQFAETPEGYELKVSLPGIGKPDAELHVEGKTLVLKTHAKYQNPAGFRQVAAEFERENYAMSVDLPEMADPATMAAKLENGLLTVAIKKRPETQPRKIDIL
ncbi:MAG: Hsp20/alpha crystallin family protein [Kiritimatiellae bacterium]|nr:Hsp20/alpha crystallin family protein [Kiritimatiellia bacterium]